MSLFYLPEVHFLLSIILLASQSLSYHHGLHTRLEDLCSSLKRKWAPCNVMELVLSSFR